MGPRNPAPPRRSTRNSAPGGRNTGRPSGGGITKRRASTTASAATRIDRDGDIDMDAPLTLVGQRSAPHNAPSGPRKSARTASIGGRGAQLRANAKTIVEKVISHGTGKTLRERVEAAARAAHKPIDAEDAVVVKVHGLKQSYVASHADQGLSTLLEFLERKATAVAHRTRPVRIKKLRGNFAYMRASPEDAEEILKINGFDFCGVKIEISEAPEGMPDGTGVMSSTSENTQKIKAQLQEILGRRYNVEAKLLDMSSLFEDPQLVQMGFFAEGTNPEKIFRTMMAICSMTFKTPQAKRDAIVSISVARNNISDVEQIMSLSETFPDVTNLDLSSNLITDLDGLKKWRFRFQKLQTLLLNGNPIETTNPTYHVAMEEWFPMLSNLSCVQIRDPEELAARQRSTTPTPIPHHGVDFRDIGGTGELFITEFMRMYDVDRAGLATKFYDSHSCFSLSIHQDLPRVYPAPSWIPYVNFTRNLSKVTSLDDRSQKLFTGKHLIGQVFAALPPTQHPALAANLDKYIIDCHPLPGLVDPTGASPAGVDGLIMTVHGQLDDQDPITKETFGRSFSRTFVLGPGLPGVQPIRVISDMLSLKPYNPVPVVSRALPAEEVRKKEMVLALSRQTGMNSQYSTMCLDGAGWVFDQAVHIFNEKRAGLPAEAFAMASA